MAGIAIKLGYILPALAAIIVIFATGNIFYALLLAIVAIFNFKDHSIIGLLVGLFVGAFLIDGPDYHIAESSAMVCFLIPGCICSFVGNRINNHHLKKDRDEFGKNEGFEEL